MNDLKTIFKMKNIIKIYLYNYLIALFMKLIRAFNIIFFH